MTHLLLVMFFTIFNGYNQKVKSVLHNNYKMSANSKFTWTNVGPEGGYFVRVAADPQDSNLAILQGIITWITRDGTNWQPLRDGGLNSYITFTGYHRLLLSVYDTLYYSSDGANTFAPIRTTGPVRALSKIASDTVYLVQDSSGVAYLYRSDDGGINWSRITPLSYTEYKYITYAPSNPDIIYMAVNISYSSDSVFIVRSDNGGINWTISSFIGDGVDVTDIEVNPQDPGEAFLSCGFDGDFGLIYTTDSFQNVTNVPGILIPYDVEFISSDTILVAGIIPTGIVRGTRSVTGWDFEPVDTLTTCTDIERSGDVFYVSATTGALKSLDGGETFAINESGLHGTFTYSGKMLSHMIGRTVYMPSIQGNALYITRNGGVTWEKIYVPHVAVIFDVEANPQDENEVYIACGAGMQNMSGNLMLFNILYSSDGGHTFIPLDTFIENPDTYNWIETLHVFSDSENVLIGMSIVYTDNVDTMKIVRSTDKGHSFTDTTGVFVEPFYEDFAGDNPVFVQADSVIFASYDYGLSFDTVIALENADMVQNLVYYDKDTLLFYDTYFNTDSVYAFRLPDLDLTCYFIPGIYLFNIAQNGGFYAIATDNNFLFYTGTYEEPFDSSETIDFLAGAIRASTNEVLLFSYGFGVFRSTDAVTKIREGYNYRKGVYILRGDVLYVPGLMTHNEIELYSLSGRLMRKYSINKNCRVNLNDLPVGVYFIKVNSTYGKLMRIVKVK